MAVTWKDIIDGVVSILSGVTGIGTVSTYLPLLETKEDAQNFVSPDSSNRFNLWVVRRGGLRIEREDAHTNSQWWRHTVVIEGWISATNSGASYDDFQDLVDDIALAFGTNITLGIDDPEDTQALDIRVTPIDVVQFAGYLCDHTRIQMDVVTLKIVTYA